MKDVTSLQWVIAELTTNEQFGSMSMNNSDCNRDGKPTMIDVTLIQRFIAQLIVEF